MTRKCYGQGIRDGSTFSRRRFLKACALTAALAFCDPLSFGMRPAEAAAGSFPVLVYHRVGAGDGALSVPASRFASDLRYLNENGYQTLGMDRLKEHATGGRPLPDKAVFLTFDDGYLDNYSNAFPLLQASGMTGNFFVISGFLGRTDRMTGCHAIEMARAGMYVGSHTVSHRPLARLEKWENCAELMRSKAELEDILGKAVDFVAYPYGSYNGDTLDAAMEAGYWGGLTVNDGYTRLADRLVMNRIAVFRQSPRLEELLS
ncbi:polysaccharide deacetylase family protein [Anaeroselena agilis]|uniref:Polysaccharide deacetylase family protein n=1 Tax=Anaeroselena agilis TaxID=3063788 RepID=A0ABU3P199_9FIRM|nr:polysaccharide deacetylase family protein [Selenomonadales bacterium 4137-cl]